MEHLNYCKDLFESIPDYGKILLILFLIQNDKKFLHDNGFKERDVNRLILEFKNIILEQCEGYLAYVKNEEGYVIEKILNK